jgi:hypothetical protein
MQKNGTNVDMIGLAIISFIRKLYDNFFNLEWQGQQSGVLLWVISPLQFFHASNYGFQYDLLDPWQFHQ